MGNLFKRGSEWRIWDLHIHTPASFQWNGEKNLLNMTGEEKAGAADSLIDALNNSPASVFAIMDYWTFEGWFLLRERLNQVGKDKLTKLVFPGIELRLVSPSDYRLNAHVIFSEDISKQDLLNFKSQLKVALIGQPLSDECLIRLAKEKTGDDKLIKIGSSREKVNNSDFEALMAGSKIAEITPESYKEAIDKVPNGKALGFMPWSTNDGLAKTKWHEHYSFVLDLMKSSPIFETRKEEIWAAFAGVITPDNEGWFSAFQAALDNTPRLAVSGSDAHAFSDYGVFPNNKATWIKSDPSFLGLLQAIKEPAHRSYIGERPNKLNEVDQNKTYYIDSLKLNHIDNTTIEEPWLDGCELPLSTDLVAIIGNKGSGKSALADIIALLGNSKKIEHFSFLSQQRFRKPPANLARYFRGEMTWNDGTKSKKLLSDDPVPEDVEMVRYIPQAHFEKLCNDHVSGKSDVFEKELREVIFSHSSSAMRQKALDFDQLVDALEENYRDELSEYRKELNELNREIANIESQLHPDKRKNIEGLHELKKKQISEHKKIEPKIESKPTDELTEDQTKAATRIETLTNKIKSIDEQYATSISNEEKLLSKKRNIEAIKEKLKLFDRQYGQFKEEVEPLSKSIDIQLSTIIEVTIKHDGLDALLSETTGEISKIINEREKQQQEKKIITKQIEELNKQLNEPQKLYERSLTLHRQWQSKLDELIGSNEHPDSLKGIEERLKQLDILPEQCDSLSIKRIDIFKSIYEVLSKLRESREALFEPVQDLIQNNELIRDEYKLQFQASLVSYIEKFSDTLFGLIKQNTGEFRGDDESRETIKKIAEKYDFSEMDGALGFVSEVLEKVKDAARSTRSTSDGVDSLLRVSKESWEVYDAIFNLNFVEPRYSLLFQETKIEQLSPGQRGSLLLIFYLLVDKGRNPIILDQPEENLDNETVVSLLVPVLSQAKKKRQIIMVTHNPNLAVVCDAEQIIYSSFDRKGPAKIEYLSGSIENPQINLHVINVLEGTKLAFDNRKGKYI